MTYKIEIIRLAFVITEIESGVVIFSAPPCEYYFDEAVLEDNNDIKLFKLHGTDNLIRRVPIIPIGSAYTSEDILFTKETFQEFGRTYLGHGALTPDRVLDSHYGIPLATIIELQNLNQSSLYDKVRHYIKEENSDYFYDSTATQGDVAPHDQIGGVGFWIKSAGSGGSQISGNFEGGSPNSIYLTNQIIEGGSPNSVYLSN